MQSSVLPPIGSPLPFPNSADVAILKYVGSVSGHEGVFCGLELCGDLAARGKNNGNVNGVRYFDVRVANSGLFVPLRKVVGWLSMGSPIAKNNNGSSTAANTNMNMTVDVSSNASTYSNTNSNSNQLSQTSHFAYHNDKMSVDLTPPNRTGSAGEMNELRRHINVLEKQLVQRENDLRDLDIQLDELDATLRANDARLSRKEDRFARYKEEKEEEIRLLVTTIEALEKKVVEVELAHASKAEGQSDSGKAAVEEELKKQIEKLTLELAGEKEMFQSYKANKSKEIEKLRNVEMDKYKLEIELEKLRDAMADDSVAAKNERIRVLEEENRELLQTVDSLKLDLELRDSKLAEIEGPYEERISGLMEQIKQYGKQLEEKDSLVAKLQEKAAAASNMVDANGGLKVFVPETATDASAGRDNFCTFCDLEGHETADCPYEKDNLEMF